MSITPTPQESAESGLPQSRLVLGSSLTPITDQRLELLKRGYSNCVPKWEDFAKEMEREMHKWKAECKQQWNYLSQARHNARAIQNIRWGHEGDCGAVRLANLIEEDCHRGMLSSDNENSAGTAAHMDIEKNPELVDWICDTCHKASVGVYPPNAPVDASPPLTPQDHAQR